MIRRSLGIGFFREKLSVRPVRAHVAGVGYSA
jgi:hypothetical protein